MNKIIQEPKLPNAELTLNVLRNIDTLKTQKTLANELGYSVGKINYVLKALGEKSLIKTENFYV